jgi:FtsZ-binding cell division protein ZapB
MREKTKEQILLNCLIRRLVLWGMALALYPALTSLPAFAEDQDDQIDNAQALIGQWVETERIISREKRDFELSKEMLAERINLVEQEIASFKEKIADAEKSIAEADKKRDDMLKENERLKAATASLGTVLGSLENRTLELLKRVPGPISEHVKPLSQRVPQKADESELSVSERFQNIVGILNELNKFNSEITLSTEIRTMPYGNSVEVTALYLGISHGYYASANGVVAGMGTASELRWEWIPDNDIAVEVLDLIAILNNEKVASFVQVPMEIK